MLTCGPARATCDSPRFGSKERTIFGCRPGADTGVEMSITLCSAKTFAVLVILGMLLMPVPVALANSAPPLELWLDFEYQTSEQPDLEGVQVIRCDTPECNQPTLLQQYGRCDSGDCLDSSPSLQTVQDLQCVEGRCVAVFHNTVDGAIPPFKVVGQFSDRIRTSDLFSDEVPMYHDTVVWRIAVQDTTLSVTVSDRTLQDPYDPYSGSFFQYFALTIGTELLVAALSLRVWRKLKGPNLLIGLADFQHLQESNCRLRNLTFMAR